MKNDKHSPFVSLVTVFALLFSLCPGIIGMNGAHTQSNTASAETKYPALARYTENLTRLARRGAFDSVMGHEAALDPTVQILSRSKQNNPVFITEDGTESKAAVQALARQIATGDVP